MDKKLVYLVQTDTTVGFSSADDEKLSAIKKRPKSQKILQTVDSFYELQKNTRVPKKFRRRVRNSNKISYIYPNGKSFRLIDKKSLFYDFISKFGSLYSTSANITKNNFEYEYAFKKSDVIVFSKDGFSEKNSSSIYKISKNKIKKIR